MAAVWTTVRLISYFLLSFMGMWLLLPGQSSSQEFGRFVGEVEVRWLGDGRNMETPKEFEYIDPDQQSWLVPKGTKTDGASVPRAFFVLYAPFTGLYRNGALVHDHFCRARTRTWQETHDAFYNALRAAGVREHDSKVMWGAVYLFGPRWDLNGKRSPGIRPDETPEDQQIAEIKALDAWVKANNPTKDELERALFVGSFKK